MNTRLLPRDEWYRLANTELESMTPYLPPDADVLVVEGDTGDIVACWALYSQPHVEGVWVAPAHRGRGGAARCLLRGMRDLLHARGAKAAITGAVSDDVRRLLEGLGATRLPGELYVLSLE